MTQNRRIYESDKNVVEMAKIRLQNIFRTSPKIYLNTSGGKDSIVLAHLIYTLIKQKKINPEKLTIRFIDEESMFEDVINIVKKWRKRFIKLGVKFEWFCLQLHHYNCLNQLYSDESFILWDSNEKENWIRPMPSFAITSHPLCNTRHEPYQDFLDRINCDGITLVGVRIDESIHRYKTISDLLTRTSSGVTTDKTVSKKLFPLYDWKDTDIWKYIDEHNLDFPITYIRLYKVGTPKNRLRISQFFGVVTAKVLTKMAKYDPTLMKRVKKREPNAYLLELYEGTELFRQSTKKQKTTQKKDYKKETIKLIKKIEKQTGKHQTTEVKSVKKTILQYHQHLNQQDWKKLYLILTAGDPKRRTIRGLEMNIYRRINK